MKKILLTTLLTAGVASAFGQGAITWGNNPTGFRAPIYGLETTGDTSVAKSGQSSIGTPTGSTVYTGALLAGTGFTFAVFAGPSSAVDSSALSFLASTTFRTSTGSAALPAGLVNGATVTVPGVNAGEQAKFQIRVWDNQGGTVTSWAQAAPLWNNGQGPLAAGVSSVVTSAALGGIGTDGNPNSTPATIGWTSFALTAAIPEPSTFVLAGLGAAGMLIFRRRK
jgi:hypothetical protein